MITRKTSLRTALALALAIPAGAFAATETLTLVLDGKSEVPAVDTTATGSGKISIQDDRLVKGSVNVSGIEPTMAHIHEGAAGESGPPIITLTKDDENSFSVPQGAKLTDAQYKSYVSGKLYVNVHSNEHPNGELRAQLIKQP